MALENGKWRVVKGDCLWNIAKSVYSNAYRWTEIADANGISRSKTTIYPGQLLTIPGVTSGTTAAGGSSTPAPAVTKPRIDFFQLKAGTEREMLAVWTWSGSGATKFQYRWEQWDPYGHLWLIEESTFDIVDRQYASSGSLRSDEGWNVCRFSVRAMNNDNQVIGEWDYKEYDFRNNPPGLPSLPTFSIDNKNLLTATFENINEDINATSIEIAIYQDDSIKYATASVDINSELHMANLVKEVEPGHNYRLRCRAVRGTVYGGWTEFTSNEKALPIAPTEITTIQPRAISEQMSTEYAIYIEWTAVSSADTYEIQYVIDPAFFDTDTAQTKTTTEEQGANITLTGLELGHTYYFKIRSVNDKGSSLDWTDYKTCVLGSKPSVPTTWSNVSSGVIGEDLNLYWVHNSTDNSVETQARVYIKVVDSNNPSASPMEYYKVVPNEKPMEDKNKTSVYTINTNDSEWSMLDAGFIITWKVQTAGVSNEYSDWSIEREINVYAKPELTIDLKNQNGNSTSEFNQFPFYISLSASPYTQKPLSYYIEIISNSSYNTIDNTGKEKVVNSGDRIYQRYYDPSTDAWNFLLELTPSTVDFESGMSYTVNCTVSMDSGLSTTATQNFDAFFYDIFYDAYANVKVDSETLEATIHPYCNEYYTDEETNEIKSKLSTNCLLSVYRIEYNGKFTEIAYDIDNESNVYVTDPHPALDYARYRIVAKSKDTGAISYADITGVKVGEPSIVIQWAEKWTNFELDDNGTGKEEPAWSGSLIKIPYNVDTSENNSLDVSLIEYAGRSHPVSYYGTQLGETASWSVEIPADDKELIYALRRLKAWSGDVYVREPSGVGYWANITVSMSMTHRQVTIPVSFNIKRVEGGI